MDSKEKTLCVLKIMMDTDQYSPANSAYIINKLKTDYGIKGVDRSSIYSDFALFEKCGFKLIEAKNKNKGRYLQHDFSDAEIKIMMDAILTAKCLNVEDTERIVKRLRALSSERGRKRFAQLISPHLKNKSEDRMAEEYLEIILEAVYNHKEIEFQYTMFDKKMNRVLRKEGRMYSFSVFSLFWENNTYYLVGMDKKHRELGNYRLDRVINVRISEEAAIDPAEELGNNYQEKVRDYIEKNVYRFGGDPIRLILECEPNQRELDILYDFASKDLRINDGTDGKIIVSMEKRNSEALISWLMQYAHMFKVVSPADVKKQLIDRIVEVCGKYQEAMNEE